jgi:hypothetical protein
MRPFAAALGHLLVCTCIATAQQGGGAAAPEQPAPSVNASEQPARIEESRPSLYFLPDKQGNLQPVLQFKYQDFVDLYKLKNQLEQREQPPNYSLQRMTVVGAANADRVELTFQFSILVRDEDWVRVPLRLDQGLLRGTPQYKGAGEQFLHYEGEGVGYVCWLRGKADSQHELTLTMLVPLSAVGEEPRLKLAMPRATASELKLTVPMAEAVGRVPEGATLLPPLAANNGATELSVVGLGGDFQLAWHRSNPHAVDTPIVLEAAATVLARLDGHSISTEATLSIRSYGAPFDRLPVRLPPGAELVAGGANGFVVTPIDSGTGNSNHRRVVEVRWPKKTAGPVDIRLACRREYEPITNQSWTELAGFEVVGAVRQWGTVAVATSGEWQVLWGASRGVRQIDQLPEALRKEDAAGGFEYVAEPYSLPVRLVPRTTRISVDPKYVLLVDRDQIRLEGRLPFTIRGAKVTTVEVALPGWELDEVGPEHLVAVDGVVVNSNVATIPLLQPSSGAIELLLRAHRAVEAGTAALKVPLPQPQAGAVGFASVVVAPADNVELTPDNSVIEGLVRERIGPAARLLDRQQEPLYYRGTGGEAVFAADFRIQSQRITVEVDTLATLAEHTATVEQKLSYWVGYEAIDRLKLAVPRALAGAKQIRILHDGKPLVPVVAAPEQVGTDETAAIAMRVTLPDPHIGAFEVQVQYSVPVVEPKPEEPSVLSVPLTMPEDGELVANRLAIKAGRNTAVSPREAEWTIAERESGGRGLRASCQVTAAKRIDRADFDLSWEGGGSTGSTTVDRAWIQSWLTSPERQDVAIYQFTTNQNELEVAFPTGVAVDQATALVAGKRAETRRVGEDRLAIMLPGEGEGRRFVVELRYHFPSPRPPHGAMQLEFPRFSPECWVRRMYWQLVLPVNEHLIGDPSGFSGESTWGWHRYFWGRQPVLDQSQLETWAGVAPRTPLPERANSYLFSAFGNVSQAEVHTGSRTWIVLWASGVALLAGLLLIYVPAARHPAVLLALGVGLLAVGLVAPEPALLFAQAASLGLILALTAGLLERGLGGRRRSMRRESASAVLEVASTYTAYHLPRTSGQAVTETSPVIVVEPPGKADR